MCAHWVVHHIGCLCPSYCIPYYLLRVKMTVGQQVRERKAVDCSQTTNSPNDTALDQLRLAYDTVRRLFTCDVFDWSSAEVDTRSSIHSAPASKMIQKKSDYVQRKSLMQNCECMLRVTENIWTQNASRDPLHPYNYDAILRQRQRWKVPVFK